MDFVRFCWFVSSVVVFVGVPTPVTAGDIVHDDKFAPKKPGCENDFVLVKFPFFRFKIIQFLMFIWYLKWIVFIFVSDQFRCLIWSIFFVWIAITVWLHCYIYIFEVNFSFSLRYVLYLEIWSEIIAWLYVIFIDLK